jgi:hypothetical protein
MHGWVEGHVVSIKTKYHQKADESSHQLAYMLEDHIREPHLVCGLLMCVELRYRVLYKCECANLYLPM